MTTDHENHTPPPLRVGYLLRMYPRFSQTFVVNEIRELERQGVDIRIASLRLPNEGVFHESVTRVRAQATYLEERFLGRGGSQLLAQWKLFRQSPRAYAEVVRLVRRHRGIEWFELCQAAALIRWAHRERVRHVHVHFGTDEADVAMFAYLLGGPSYSLTLHAFDIFRDNVDRSLLAAKINASRFTVTVCQSNGAYLRRALPGVDPRKIHVNYNGINLDEFSPGDSVREPYSVFSVGRLIEKKGFVHLIRAMGALRDRGLPVVCRIAGEGRDEALLRREIHVRNLGDRVHLMGSLRQDEVRQWMRHSSCFALPCVQAKDGNIDALPTVLLESLACACPSVSTRLSGVPEIIENGESGLLVEPEDDAALADAIGRVLIDAKLSRSLAEQGRRRAEQLFDARQNVARMREFFADVAQGETSPADVRPVIAGESASAMGQNPAAQPEAA
ncbi:MAG: glycosyltransferase family 4 protein [Phycisphaerales bacterium]|nr:glycosyltransferase family 4 protein [Phycisphaerales bacterium]